MILMIDNYDSFTYNLVQYFQMLGQEVQVYRNDRITVQQARDLHPEALVISPGPCTPEQAGMSVPLIQEMHTDLPILGVCLGLQSIVTAFGGDITQATRLMHGKVSQIEHDGEGIFSGIKSPFPAIRYHSLAAEKDHIPACLQITAHADDGEVMGLRHNKSTCVGIQFHPESILTPSGKRILGNFLKLSGIKRS